MKKSKFNSLRGPGSSAIQFGPFSDPFGQSTRCDGNDDWSDFGVGHMTPKRSRKDGCVSSCPGGQGGCADCNVSR